MTVYVILIYFNKSLKLYFKKNNLNKGFNILLQLMLFFGLSILSNH